MSELKAQVLGILLVILLFGTVAATFTAIINNANNKMTSDYENYTSQKIERVL